LQRLPQAARIGLAAFFADVFFAAVFFATGFMAGMVNSRWVRRSLAMRARETSCSAPVV
jgi:hypothetical protein